MAKSSNLAKRTNGVTKQTVIPPLSAGNLRDVLWTTLNDLRDGAIDVDVADAVAGQAREILYSFKVQLQIAMSQKKQLAKTAQAFNG